MTGGGENGIEISGKLVKETGGGIGRDRLRITSRTVQMTDGFELGETKWQEPDCGNECKSL